MNAASATHDDSPTTATPAWCTFLSGSDQSGVTQPIAPARSRRSGGLAPWKVKRLAQHVERHLDRSLETEELAKVAGLSLFHFSREFRTSFGVPPHRYVIQERIGRAKRLMIGTDHSITEIAAECGLADQAHLTKLFKRFSGETPGVWRRAHKNPQSINFLATGRHLRAPTA